jgi:putative NIF3 family GTP cyclohydrolase 1 type 2
MTINDIYKLSIEKGIDADPRGRERVEKMLARKREKFEKLDEHKKDEFDQESLQNPYSDTRILHIADDREIKKVLVGIDIEAAEILLAKQLGDIDLVISHHPNGRAYTDLHEVMDVQVDVMNYYGVPVNVAESLMRERMSEVSRSMNPRNTWRAVDAAKLLGVNLMCMHTVADNHAEEFLREKIEADRFERVEDVMKFLGTIEEYKKAKELGMGPKLFSGRMENRCGNIYIGMTGGTEPPAKLYGSMAQAGIGTIVSMHLAEDSRKEAEAASMNIIVTGHMSSDSIGMNLILDDIEKQNVEVVPCSGLIRVSRVV